MNELFVFNKNGRKSENNSANAFNYPQFREKPSLRGCTFASVQVHSGIPVDSLDRIVRRGRVEGLAIVRPANVFLIFF